MIHLAIDPGSTESAIVVMSQTPTMLIHDKLPNEDVMKIVTSVPHDYFTIEGMQRMGKMLNIRMDYVFEAAFWIGRFFEASKAPHRYIAYRRDIKYHLTGSTSSKDGDIRRAMMVRYGKNFTKDFRSDQWSALAIATYAMDMKPWEVSVRRDGNKIVRI